MTKLLKRIKRSIVHRIDLLRFNVHMVLYTPLKLRSIRHKKHIKYLFLLTELPTWKTEPLYKQMLLDDRFEPILGVTTSIESPAAEIKLRQYLDSKGYNYIEIDKNQTIVSQCRPDIIMYQKPYLECRHDKHQMKNNLGALFTICEYGFHTSIGRWQMLQPVHRYGLHYYFENQSLAKQYARLMPNHGRNIRLTGTPSMDLMMQMNSSLPDPWKDNSGKKRIIYAPHHTIGDLHFKNLAFSTFLENAELFLQLAEKYRNKVQFAFKPHPRLYINLLKVWGKEKTDNYYNRWNTKNNCQLETGAYNGLFYHSDALIHDCGAFMVEYLYTGKPLMYLEGGNSDFSEFAEFSKQAYEKHYHGSTATDIEAFITDVIAGRDSRKAERMSFVDDNLRPPYGRTACENIINAIVGEREFSNQ